jgi:hypothetical protein
VHIFYQMKNYLCKIVFQIAVVVLPVIILSCNSKGPKYAATNGAASQTNTKHTVKPAATYQDTLLINFAAAVFYKPDSLQLLKIKLQTDSMIFDGSMHEFFYQMRNARMVIQKTWPALKITDVKNYRYLLFIAADNTRQCIDLNTKTDACGLLVFSRKKPPLTIDMMNIETAVSFYLKD